MICPSLAPSWPRLGLGSCARRCFRAQCLGTGGIGEEFDDQPYWVVSDAWDDFADDAGVAGDANAVADLERRVVVEVSGGDDLVAAT